MSLELATRSRRRAARTRRSIVWSTSLLLVLVALSFVLPAAVGLSFHSVTDDAMSGTVNRGSAVVVDSVPVADLQVGDVIAYPVTSQSGTSSLVTRRIAEIDGSVFRTSSDRGGDLDPWTLVLDQSRQDAVVSSVPYAGHVVDALDGSVRSWLAAALVLVLAATVLTSVLDTRRDQRLATSTPTARSSADEPLATRPMVPAPRGSTGTRRGSTV